MFGDLSNEKEEWDKFFNFFVEKFKEEVGICPAAFSNDEYELDIMVGDDSCKVLGIRVYQAIPVAEAERDSEEEEDEQYDIYVYDLIREDDLSEDLETQDIALEFDFDNPMFDDGFVTNIKIFKNEEGALIYCKETDKAKNEVISRFVANDTL